MTERVEIGAELRALLEKVGGVDYNSTVEVTIRPHEVVVEELVRNANGRIERASHGGAETKRRIVAVTT